MKKLVAFDLDDALAVTKSAISPQVAELLAELAGLYEVCVITGGPYKQMEDHVIDRLTVIPSRLAHIHFMAVNGAQYHHYDLSDDKWHHDQLTEDLSPSEKLRISNTLEKVSRELGYWEENPTGPIIADRGTQITYSALGQRATPADKYAWDPKFAKRRKMYERVVDELPEFEVRINGKTSIDVTSPGIHKGFGIEKLRKKLNIDKDEILFVGDQLQEGGNDYPVKELGIDTINVHNVQQTELVIEGLISERRKNMSSSNPLSGAKQIPEALETIVKHLIMLHVSSREDMKQQVSELLKDHDAKVFDTHNTTAMVFQFIAGSVHYGLKIEFGAAEVVRGEARWYELAPPNLKPHHVLSHLAGNYTFVLLRWLQNARRLEQVAIDNEGKATEQTMDLIIKALDQDKELFNSYPTVPLDTSRGSSFFFDKYHSYNAGAKKFPYLQELIDRDTVKINDKVYPGPYHYVLAVQQDKELRTYLSPDRAGLIHGDANTNNLLVEDNRVYLIDPKGTDHLPFEYDTGRIYWAVSGWNAILLGEYNLRVTDDGYGLDVAKRQQYVDGMPRLRNYFTPQEFHRAMYSSAMQYLTRVHHASKQDETTALYLRGLQVFDDLFSEIGATVKP